MGSVAKSYMRKGFLIYEEMRKYLTINEQVVCHIYMTFAMRKILFSFVLVYVHFAT
jgi:hypothetical protein